MENWLVISSIGYLLLAFEAVMTKILLTNSIKSWQLYSFYVGLLSLNGIFFAPFGLQWFGYYLFFESLLSGLIFFLALVFLYKALRKSSASRVFVLYGAIVTLFSFFFSKILLGEVFSNSSLIGLVLLLVGGFFISFKIHERRLFDNYKEVIFAGFLMALALIMMKDIFDRQNFITGYVFSRVGVFLSALFLMFSAQFRGNIQKHFRKKSRKDNQKNFGLVLLTKIISGLGTILINYSISIGSVVLINALVSIQYLATFVLAILASIFLKKNIQEKITWQNLIFKFAGAFLIAGGVFLIK